MATGKKRGKGRVAVQFRRKRNAQSDIVRFATAKAADAEFRFKTTAELKVPGILIDQIVGQEDAVQVIKKAAKQRRHVLLIGDPGTGKSMMGMAMAELLPREKLVSIMAFANPNDENQPMIRVVPAHQGRDIVTSAKLEAGKMSRHVNLILIVLLVASLVMPWWAYNHYSSVSPILGGIMFLTFSLFGFASMVSFILFLNLGRRVKNVINVPKIVVNNFDQKTAPFYDATGAHAGALLGDVLHDPFQSLKSGDKIWVIGERGEPKSVPIGELVNRSFLSTKAGVLRKAENNYEAAHLSLGELRVLGVQNGAVSPVDVLSVNRYDYEGDLIKLKTSENGELVVTPEHRVAIRSDERIDYVEAKHVKENDELVAIKEGTIIDEDNIISTYDERQQEQCRLYYDYVKLKAANPLWGYKRIAKALGQPIGKTRWWHAKRHTPVPIQTADWLKERGLLPLKADNSKLPLIARLTGATFGDGGIFANLNGVFLSSSEKEAVEEFGKDLENIFGLNNNENSRIIEGGVYGHSWCYQNTNRNVIRLLVALGVPVGKKSEIELKVPSWIYLSKEWQKEFFGSLLGAEMGVPKVHVSRQHLNTFDFAITGTEALERSRMEFLQAVANYLKEKEVKMTSVIAKETKNPGVYLYRLLLSTELENVINFITLVKLNYCKYKMEKLVATANEFMALKRDKYHQMLERGYGAESIMKLLRITPAALYQILNYEEVEA